MLPRRLTLLWLLGIALSCAPRPGAGEFISVKVTWASGVTARCFVVRVNAEGQAARTTKPMVRTPDDQRLDVAIFRDESPAEVSLEALGFADEACLEPTEERSALTTASFVKALSETGVELHVLEKPIAVGTDLDGDGSATPEDCDDGNPGVRPGLPEACGDTFDNDCDDIFDCDDPDCVAQSCGLGRVCIGAFCGEAACTNGVDDDGDQQIDCADSDCTDKPCGVGGTCRLGRCLAATEARCDDGDDNDGNGLTDCLDPQCDTRACSDGDGCTVGESCQGVVCGGGSARDCGLGLPMCLLNAGCDAGQCLATPKASGSSCGTACTQPGTCDGDGGCSGAPVVCPAAPGACFGAGVCQIALDGGCSYPVLTGSTCSDLDSCTTQDSCQGDGGCAGTRLSCTPPHECLAWANTCTTGACDFAPRVGIACDGGSCSAAGVCTPGGKPWPYVPSNFDPGVLPFTDAGIKLDCVEVIIDSDPIPATVSGTGCSAQAVLPSNGTRLVSTDGLVFAASSLFIDAGARLILVGAHPVIFAVHGDVTIAGQLLAVANGPRPAAGADLSCGSAAGTTGTAGTESSPGGSGGAFGSAGGAGGVGSGNAGTAPAESAPLRNRSLVPLRGGCSGGAGAGTSGGTPGRAGGGVQVSATGSMVISGLVGAPGEGGGGGRSGSSGGGGAGSGGGILLEASSLQLTLASRVLALGGGGGEGGSTLNGNDGSPGSRTDGAAAPGGDFGSPLGGTGGTGASRSADAGAGGQGYTIGVFGAGGGGGAGVGRVRFNALTCNFVTGSLVSPAPTSADGGCQ